MQALTAARFDDVLAHVTFTGTGSKDSRLYPLWDQTRGYGTRGTSHPHNPNPNPNPKTLTLGLLGLG